ncbi:unnamed protein product, partial [Sphacelaria rigidula]
RCPPLCRQYPLRHSPFHPLHKQQQASPATMPLAEAAGLCPRASRGTLHPLRRSATYPTESPEIVRKRRRRSGYDCREVYEGSRRLLSEARFRPRAN